MEKKYKEGPAGERNKPSTEKDFFNREKIDQIPGKKPKPPLNPEDWKYQFPGNP